MNKFYKDGDVWVVMDYDNLPARSCTREINPRTGMIKIQKLNGDVIAQGLPTEFTDKYGNHYASLAAFKKATNEFFNVQSGENALLAVYGSQIVTGATKTAIKAGYYAHACTCRTDGSKIASLEKTVGAVVSADTDESITGIAMYVGEYQPFINKVTSVTQTAAGDSITYWLKPL
jgi:hypothetical protein